MKRRRDEDEDPDDPYIKRRLQKSQMMEARTARLAAREARLKGESAPSPILPTPTASQEKPGNGQRRQSAPSRVSTPKTTATNKTDEISHQIQSYRNPPRKNGRPIKPRKMSMEKIARDTIKATGIKMFEMAKDDSNQKLAMGRKFIIRKNIKKINIGKNDIGKIDVGKNEVNKNIEIGLSDKVNEKESDKIFSSSTPSNSVNWDESNLRAESLRPPPVRRYSNKKKKSKIHSGEEILTSSGIEIISSDQMTPDDETSTIDSEETEYCADEENDEVQILAIKESSDPAGGVEENKNEEIIDLTFDSIDAFNFGLEALCRDLALDLKGENPPEDSAIDFNSLNEIAISEVTPEESQEIAESGGEIQKDEFVVEPQGPELIQRRDSSALSLAIDEDEISNLLALRPSESLLAHERMNVSSCGGSEVDRLEGDSESDGIPPDLDFSLHNSSLEESVEAFETSMKLLHSREKSILDEVEEKEREMRRSSTASRTNSASDVEMKDFIASLSSNGVEIKLIPSTSTPLTPTPLTSTPLTPTPLTSTPLTSTPLKKTETKTKKKIRIRISNQSGNMPEMEITKIDPPGIKKTEEEEKPKIDEMEEEVKNVEVEDEDVKDGEVIKEEVKEEVKVEVKKVEKPRLKRVKDEAPHLRSRDSLIARRRLRSRPASNITILPRRPDRIARKRKEENEERQVGKRRREPPSFLRDYEVTKDLRGFEGKTSSSREKNGFPILTAGEALRAILSIPEPLLPSSHLAYFHRFKRSVNLLSDTEEAKLREIIRAKQGKKTQKVVLNRIRESRLLFTDGEKPLEGEEGEEGEEEEEKKEGEENSNPKPTKAVSISSSPRRVFNLRSSMSRNGDETVPAKPEILDDFKVLIAGVVVNIDHRGYTKETDVPIQLDEDFIPVKEKKLVILLPEEDPKRENGVVECLMKEGACRLGCVCGSISSTQRPRDHCGRPKCFFQCNCSFPFELKRGMIYDHESGDIRSRLRTRNKNLKFFKTKKENSPPRKIRKIGRERTMGRSMERQQPKLNPQVPQTPQMSLITLEPGPEEIDTEVDFITRFSPTMFSFIASDFEESEEEDDRMSKTLTPSNVLNRVTRVVPKFPVAKNKPGYNRPRLPDNRLKPPSPLPDEFDRFEENQEEVLEKEEEEETQEIVEDDDEEYKPPQAYRQLYPTRRRKRRIQKMKRLNTQRHAHQTIRKARLNKSRSEPTELVEPLKLKLNVKSQELEVQVSPEGKKIKESPEPEKRKIKQSPESEKKIKQSPEPEKKKSPPQQRLMSPDIVESPRRRSPLRKKSVRFSERISVKTIKSEPHTPKVLRVNSLKKKSNLKSPSKSSLKPSPSPVDSEMTNEKSKKRLEEKEIMALGEKMSKECQEELAQIKAIKKIQAQDEEKRARTKMEFLNRNQEDFEEKSDEVIFKGKTYGRRSFQKKTLQETLELLPDSEKWKIEDCLEMDDTVFIEGDFSFDDLNSDYEVVEVTEFDDEIMEIPVPGSEVKIESEEQLIIEVTSIPTSTVSIDCPPMPGPSRAVAITTTTNSIRTPRTSSYEIAGGVLEEDRDENCIILSSDLMEFEDPNTILKKEEPKDSIEIHPIREHEAEDFFDEDDEDGEYEVIKVVVGDDFDLEDDSQVFEAVEKTDALYKQALQENGDLGENEGYTYKTDKMTVTLMPNKK